MFVILFLICLAASCIGAIVGAGGGVIIKPVIDMLGLLPVATASFCSGCTVLGMSVSSLIRGRNNDVRLHKKVSTVLAVGSVLGGLLGKYVFEVIRSAGSDENLLGAVQSGTLTIVTLLTFAYICRKDKLPSHHVQNLFAVFIIGGALGAISTFLGIGGGVNNVAVLFFFFSMPAKEAAKNSLYIILFSQITNLLSAIFNGTVPEFSLINLIAMVCGGIGGAILGAYFSKGMSNHGVEHLLKGLSLAITLIALYNFLRFLVLGLG